MSKLVQRREFLKGMVVVPAVLVLPHILEAADKPKASVMAALDEADPMANALKYKKDASKADANFRKDKTATCSNCLKFNKCSAADSACKPVDKKAAEAPCELFAGKVVDRKGWCMSWSKA